MTRRSTNIRELLARLGGAERAPLIGIVDGPPDLDVAEFEGARLSVEPLMLPDAPFEPDTHGTEVCGLILGRRFGFAPDLAGLALPVFFRGRSDGGAPSASQMDLARALTIAVGRGAEIVNVSAGQKASSPEAARHLTDAVALCAEKRVLIVASAGNDGCPCIHVPAAMPTVLAVGAMTEAGEPLEPSNWGDAYTANGLLAPGHELATVTVGGAEVRRSGTSFAAALVSSVAAKLLAVARERGYRLDAVDVGRILLASATPCDAAVEADCRRVLAGRIDVQAALDRLHRIGAESVRPPPKAEPTTAITGNRGKAMAEGSGLSVESSVMAQGFEQAEAAALTPQGCSCGGSSSAAPSSRQTRDEDTEAATRAHARQSADAELSQQGCACESKSAPQLVYAIGALWFDFGTEARYDAIVQQMGDPVAANNPERLFAFLSENIAFASGVTFVLMQDQIPIYAIAPSGPFAVDVYRAMLEAMTTSLDTTGDLQRVAAPGFMSGTTRLMNGMTLPVLYPDIRGMTKWRAGELATAARSAVGDDAIRDESIFEFLVRVYDELRNLGISPQERAMNFAATNAYQAAVAFGDGARRELELYRITVKKSPICRPESDCWDVQLVMFDAENERRAARVYRYTVDVSEVLPVTVGVMRSWSAPLAAALAT
jgi:cyanobactin maturation PatA/PatG family protease